MTVLQPGAPAAVRMLVDTVKYADVGGNEVAVVEQRRVETQVGQLAVRVLGQGPIAVLWHSLFVDERSWGRVENELATQRRLVMITGPGHGASGDPGRRYTLDDCAEAARAVLDTVGPDEPVDWLGNAWGGSVGLVFAARWPERCRTLVTLGTPVQSLTLVERFRTMSLLVAYRLLGPAGFIRKGTVDVMLSARTRTQDPAAVALLEDALIHADPAALSNAIVSISLRRSDLTQRLAEISVPTLFVTGSDHKGWTPQQAVAASQVLPHGSTAVVADASYLVPFENPAATIQLVRQFWDDHSSPITPT